MVPNRQQQLPFIFFLFESPRLVPMQRDGGPPALVRSSYEVRRGHSSSSSIGGTINIDRISVLSYSGCYTYVIAPVDY